ncbi:MAG: hypothetical protein KJ799_05330 [Bacteroidetes bacterium]|nr:hypothetical protein [Bacteroidota bacterium]MBU1680952.1 hypothetical protein [Bacteroidota bacterium]MBU2506130.1 hypothetical protein [Bacteroidota bacterium]
MGNILIFLLHIIFAIVLFWKFYKYEGKSAAFQNLLFIVLIFAIGWPIATMIAKLLFTSDGLGIPLDVDKISITIQSTIESWTGISLTKSASDLFDDSENLNRLIDFDTIPLLILTIGEFLLYRVYYRKEFSIAGGKEKQ